jgi:hypothetical protein
MIEFGYQENQLAIFLTEVHHPATRGLAECTDTNAGRFANCRWYHQDLRADGGTYRFITQRFKCNFRAITVAPKGDGQPKKMERPKKTTPPISSYIETLSCLFDVPYCTVVIELRRFPCS